MTHEEKTNYMRIAAGICSFNISNEHLDELVSLYELVIEKQGEGTLRDALRCQSEAKSRAELKHKQELLDKVSNKKE